MNKQEVNNVCSKCDERKWCPHKSQKDRFCALELDDIFGGIDNRQALDDARILYNETPEERELREEMLARDEREFGERLLKEWCGDREGDEYDFWECFND